MDFPAASQMNLSEGSDESKKQSLSRSLVLALCAACIGGTFQYGYNISVINAATKPVHTFINRTWKERYQTDISGDLLTLLWSTIVSMFTLGGLIGSLIGGSLSVRLGRKGTLLINNVFVLVAALLMGLSRPTGLYELLIVGRLLTGINAGIGLCVQPLYLGEISPTAHRGFMTMGTSVFLTAGILAGQVMGLKEVLGKEQFWPVLLSTTCIPAFLQLLVLPFFPESPRYLLIDRGDDEGCKEALQQLHGVSSDVELEDIRKEKENLVGFRSTRPWELFSDPGARWRLVTIVLLNAAQQLNGINAIYFYTTYVLKQAGIPDHQIPYATVGTGACECITALTCGLLIERLGRKVLITGGYALMAVFCVLLTVTMTFQDVNPVIPYLSMVSVFAFILSFGLGPGGITTVLTMELFTQASRSAGIVIAGAVNWISFFFISMVFPFIVIGLRQYCFLLFMVICCLTAFYLILVVPETKNKTFLEIQNLFQSPNYKRFLQTLPADPESCRESQEHQNCPDVSQRPEPAAVDLFRPN